MSLNDDSAIHIQAIRRALANDNAAVMVGAGFSLNAEGGDQLRLWSALGQELWVALNPTVSRTDFPPTTVAQLAEQYARVFSRPALEDLLKRHIPDNRVVPGDLHMQLLQLPWCEIFTTNYDTLLERAAENLLYRAHFTVCCREDIPQSKILGRRRIVKLHGSFPSHRPFIITEEDYRQYPERCAPFVNLVRQSLLENVFCLIGFSGEDPNFLHWIGWVRDVLDQHALPIYLFTDHEPTFGERKLLEMRRVIPVTLPYPSGNENADYGQRVAELFRQLAEPLKPLPNEWGGVRWPTRITRGNETATENLMWLLDAFPEFLALRQSYPGWMVAPDGVRRRLKSTIESMPISLCDASILRYLESGQSSAIGMVLASHYTWVQSILLLPLLDSTAEFGIRMLRTTSQHVLANQSDLCKSTLRRLGVNNEQTFDRYWRELALKLVQWARQGMHLEHFAELCSLIRQRHLDDVELDDQLQYESILLDLHEGERALARLRLSQWNVRSSDPYMRFRKGMLLAEVGNPDAALELCSGSIQMLRKMQKIRPESALLLSQEAWACLILSRLLRGWRLLAAWSKRVPKSDEEADNELKSRLLYLAAKGFDARADLSAATAALNAEAMPPSEPRYQAGEFDLGHVRTVYRLAWSVELTEKIDAALAWLELTERVGLVPRFGEVANDPALFSRAAWWIQYGDSPRRTLSVIVRTMSADCFQPQDPSLPSGRSGWLSRYQVARLDPQFARTMCERSLRQVELALASQTDEERTCLFYVELFSRLILRIDDLSEIQSMAQRVIALHSQIAFEKYSRLWPTFARALARCFEAMPDAYRIELIDEVIRMPLVPLVEDPNHAPIGHWLQLHKIDAKIEAGQDVPATLSSHVDDLIRQLGAQDSKPLQHEALWGRLVWLDENRVLSAKQRDKLAQILWQDSDGWPLIPGYSPSAALLFPAPSHELAAERFRHWILSAGVSGFRRGERRWGLHGDQTFFKCWLDSLRNEPWPVEAWLSGLHQIIHWWESERQDLTHAVRLEGLDASLTERLNLVDGILADPNLWVLAAQSDVIRSALDTEIASMAETGFTLAAPFWRFRINRARHANDGRALNQIGQEIASTFLSSRNIARLQEARAVAQVWIQASLANDVSPRLVLDTIIAVFVSRRVISLPFAMGVLANLLWDKPKVLDQAQVAQIFIALDVLLGELSYERETIGSAIPDDEVPTLRFLCARLSSLLIDTDVTIDKSAAEKWLLAAANDPLPEMRFRRYLARESGDK